MRLLARLLVVTVFLALVGTAVLASTDLVLPSGSGDRSSDPAGAASTTGRLTMAPSIVQPGTEPADSSAARSAFEARFTPARRNGLVVLERQTAQGWRTVARGRQDADGVARLTAPAGRGGTTFRATALWPDGTRRASTNELVPAEWTPVFGDDFDGTVLDSTKWMYRQVGLYNDGGRKCSKSDERAVSVAEGTLRLQVMGDPDRAWESCETEHGTFDYYLNGHIATQGIFDFKYGVAAARVKFPQGRGQHGAFWLQTGAPKVPGDPASSGAEVDVVEFFGDGFPGGGLASFLYYLNAEGENEQVGGVWPKATKQLPPGDAWWSSYHVFSVDWTPTRYVFRVDGREIFRTREGVSGVEQYLILSLLSSDWELPRLDETGLPNTMEVDWVRVWQRGDAQR